MSDRQDDLKVEPYGGPAGGYGSLKSVAKALIAERVPQAAATTLNDQNKPDGFMCVSCSWGKPAQPHPFEYCENGAKATAWETTAHRVGPDFFARHTLCELEGWSDHDLEKAGRLTTPMRWNPASDRYEPVSWEFAFEEIGRELRALADDPDRAVFYTSGRASLEACYMFQLLARMYGTNNLPDSSNMCHESTSVALPESIGVSVGTVKLEDFAQTEFIIYLGHNVATSAPRMLHQLEEARKRGVTIVSVNPLRERGLERFKNPQKPRDMITGREVRISDEILQVKVGGDTAALTGICKALIERDDALTGADGEPTDRDALRRQSKGDAAFSIKATAAGAKARRVLDHDFIAEHTAGFEAFADWCRKAEWSEIEQVSGLRRDQLGWTADRYAEADKAIAMYGMGITQHVGGVEAAQMICNLLLLRGNIGKGGAGVLPVRGHSNVQGQRTVGITEKPELAPLDKLKELYGFEPPRGEGMTTVKVLEGMIGGKVRAYVANGGNMLRAAPDHERVEAAWRKLRLTVAIATKLNRSHVVHGEIAYLLPCLGRIEIDKQASGPQAVSVESSIAQFHGSKGKVKPASPHLLSEPAIIAGIAKATLAPNPKVPWDEWVGDYGLVRDAIEATWPATFRRFNARLFTPGGIERPLAARERKWNTLSGKANFKVPSRLFGGSRNASSGDNVLQLTTFRSNGQFNTTVYNYDDRFRGISGSRMVVFMNAADVARLGLAEADEVELSTAIDDGRERKVGGFRVVTYDIPAGCCGAYFPEANPLIPLEHHDEHALTPAYKATPVRVRRASAPIG